MEHGRRNVRKLSAVSAVKLDAGMSMEPSTGATVRRAKMADQIPKFVLEGDDEKGSEDDRGTRRQRICWRDPDYQLPFTGAEQEYIDVLFVANGRITHGEYHVPSSTFLDSERVARHDKNHVEAWAPFPDKYHPFGSPDS